MRDGFSQAIVSVVTETELLVQPIRENRYWEVDQIGVVLSSAGVFVVELNRQIGQVAAGIRAKHGLALADAAIIATALYSGCDAVVGNDEQCARRVTEVPYVLLDELAKER